MATIAQWVRLALTGDPESATPADAVITMLSSAAIQQINQSFSTCLAGAPGSLTDDDLAAYNEAVGASIAAKLVLTPGGQQWAQYVVTTKIGPVTRSKQSLAQTATEANQALLGASSEALARIACVRETLAAAPRPGLVTLSGRRRSLGCGC